MAKSLLDFVFLTSLFIFALNPGFSAKEQGEKDLQSKTCKKVIFIAGKKSHWPGHHEHLAACNLFKKCLENHSTLQISVHSEWPNDPTIFEDADAIIIYADGGEGHPAFKGDRLQHLKNAISHGAGLGCIHYAIETPKQNSAEIFLDWIGGYYKQNWSVNPHWNAQFEALPDHPITRGVKPFEMLDEWYYHMRFQDGMKGVTPILSALPPASSLERPDGPHSGNPHVRGAVARGELQHVMWAIESPDGGRGFGFTGGHLHHNWEHESYRKIVLNAILWCAKIDVPENGVESIVTPKDMEIPSE